MTNNRKIISMIYRDKLTCYAIDLRGWNSVEVLWEYLQKKFKASCLDKIDGPDCRRWIIEIGGKIIELQYDDFSDVCYIISSTTKSDALLLTIAEALKTADL